MPITIRSAQRHDLTALYRLARNPKLAAPSHQAAERWWIKSFLEERQILIVAELSGRVIGFIMGETGTGKVAIGHLLVVQRSYQQKGIAQRLGRAFERECRRRGMTLHPALRLVARYGTTADKSRIRSGAGPRVPKIPLAER